MRREELLRIAGALFAERGYAATTVRDIAEEAGILSGSLYHHFDSKEAIVDAILTRFVRGTVARCEAAIDEKRGPRETFEGLVRASLATMVEDRDAILIYRNEGGFLAEQERFSYLRDARRRLKRLWTGVLKEGVESGAFRPDIDPRLVLLIVDAVVWTAPRWYRPGGRPGPKGISEQCVAVLVGGVARA